MGARSHLTQVRGLKLNISLNSQPQAMSHLTQVRGLKHGYNNSMTIRTGRTSRRCVD